MVPFMMPAQSRMHGLKKRMKNDMINPGGDTRILFHKNLVCPKAQEKFMIFDTHTHYDDGQFEEDREKVLLSLRERGVGAAVNMGASMQGAKDSVALAGKYPFLYAAVGIHPDHAKELNEEEFAVLKELAQEKNVVAIGEIGLDYYWNASEREVQHYWFQRQLALALELSLPVVIHSREAAADTMRVMKETYAQSGGKLRGVIHCYSYGTEQAKEYIDMGFFLGIGGVVTFKNGRKLKEVLGEIPLESIVLETDCPYLAPEPHRGKRNDSGYLSYVVSAIAAIKDVTEEEVEKVTWNNAVKLYGISERKEGR